MASVVDEAEPILTGSGRRLQDIYPLLHESWRMKRGIADRISNEHIDAIYETGLMAGALGGKLQGPAAAASCCFSCRQRGRSQCGRAAGSPSTNPMASKISECARRC